MLKPANLVPINSALIGDTSIGSIVNPKINGISGGSTRVESGQRSGDVKSGSKSDAAASAADQVSLTDSARLMVRLETILDDLPTIDRERVETIKQAIADGSYVVNPEKVAAEVLRMEMDMRRQ